MQVIKMYQYLNNKDQYNFDRILMYLDCLNKKPTVLYLIKEQFNFIQKHWNQDKAVHERKNKFYYKGHLIHFIGNTRQRY